MKKLARVFICAYSVLFLLFFAAIESKADFISESSINTTINLKAGYLSLDVKASQEALSFSDKGTSQDLSLTIKNTGTLEGKVTFSITSISMDNQNMTVDQASEYIELADLKKIDQIAAGESKSANIKLTRKKVWSDKTPIKITIQTTISQVNLADETIGFIDRKETNISLNSKSATDAWPENLLFNQAGYALGQQMYYSVVDNKYTTVVPGIIFIKYKYNQTMSESDIKTVSQKIINSINPFEGISYTVDSIKYIPNKGFKVQVSLVDASASNEFIVNGIQILYANIENNPNLEYGSIQDFCKAIILESDTNQDKKIISHNLFSSNSGVTYQMFSNTGNGSLDYGLNKIDIRDYLTDHYDIEITNNKSNNIDILFLNDHSFVLKQKISEGGQISKLIFRDKLTKEVVFSRDILSITQADFSKKALSMLTTDFQFSTFKNNTISNENSFDVTADFYMKIPSNFLVNYYISSIDNQSGLVNTKVSYSADMNYLKISFHYQFGSEPNEIYTDIHFEGFKFGIGDVRKDITIKLYPLLSSSNNTVSEDYTNANKKVQTSTSQSITESTNINDINDIEQSVNIDSNGTTNESKTQSSETSSDYQPESSTIETSQSTESTVPTTNQTEPSKEPE